MAQMAGDYAFGNARGAQRSSLDLFRGRDPPERFYRPMVCREKCRDYWACAGCARMSQRRGLRLDSTAYRESMAFEWHRKREVRPPPVIHQ
jgi:hypothetical protein